MRVSFTLCISQFQQCPSPSPPGANCRTLVHIVSPEGGLFAMSLRPGGQAFAYPGKTPAWAFETDAFESAMNEFIGKDEAFVEQCLARKELAKLVDVF